MNIPDIYTSDYSPLGTSRASASAAAGAAEKAASPAASTAAVREDTVVKSDNPAKNADTGIYSREAIIESLKNAEQVREDNFRRFIESMISGQAGEANLAIAGLQLNVTPEASRAAMAAISEGGEYSVEAVAGRIMDMAKALAGGDSSKIEMLRNAVIKGFSGAASALGLDYDDMPDITKQTYDVVMQRFDDWSASFENPAE